MHCGNPFIPGPGPWLSAWPRWDDRSCGEPRRCRWPAAWRTHDGSSPWQRKKRTRTGWSITLITSLPRSQEMKEPGNEVDHQFVDQRQHERFAKVFQCSSGESLCLIHQQVTSNRRKVQEGKNLLSTSCERKNEAKSTETNPSRLPVSYTNRQNEKLTGRSGE